MAHSFQGYSWFICLTYLILNYNNQSVLIKHENARVFTIWSLDFKIYFANYRKSKCTFMAQSNVLWNTYYSFFKKLIPYLTISKLEVLIESKICFFEKIDSWSWSSTGLEYWASFWNRDAVFRIRLPSSVPIFHE